MLRAGHKEAAPAWGAVILGAIVGLEALYIAGVLALSVSWPSFGLDFRLYVDASARFLATGTPYWPWQLAGPYAIAYPAVLYPPVAFYLFALFLVVPAPVWWAVPIGVVLYALYRARPSRLRLALFGACWLLPPSLGMVTFGNPGIWIVAAVAAGTVWGWPAALVLIKPTFAPLALLGIRDRRWWITVGVLALLTLPLWHATLDWLGALRNSDGTLLYNWPVIPATVSPLLLTTAVPSFAGRRGLKGGRASRAPVPGDANP